MLFVDDYAVGCRKDLNGILLLDTALQPPVGKAEDLVHLELPVTEVRRRSGSVLSGSDLLSRVLLMEGVLARGLVAVGFDLQSDPFQLCVQHLLKCAVCGSADGVRWKRQEESFCSFCRLFPGPAGMSAQGQKRGVLIASSCILRPSSVLQDKRGSTAPARPSSIRTGIHCCLSTNEGLILPSCLPSEERRDHGGVAPLRSSLIVFLCIVMKWKGLLTGSCYRLY